MTSARSSSDTTQRRWDRKIDLEESKQVSYIVPGRILGWRYGPKRRHTQHCKAFRKQTGFGIAGDARRGCAYGPQGQVSFFGHGLQFARETGRICSVDGAQEHTAPWHRDIVSRLAGCRGCRSNAANIDHFVWAYFFEDTVQAAPAGPLLRDESDGRRAGFL